MLIDLKLLKLAPTIQMKELKLIHPSEIDNDKLSFLLQNRAVIKHTFPRTNNAEHLEVLTFDRRSLGFRAQNGGALDGHWIMPMIFAALKEHGFLQPMISDDPNVRLYFVTRSSSEAKFEATATWPNGDGTHGIVENAWLKTSDELLDFTQYHVSNGCDVHVRWPHSEGDGDMIKELEKIGPVSSGRGG